MDMSIFGSYLFFLSKKRHDFYEKMWRKILYKMTYFTLTEKLSSYFEIK